MAQAIRAFFAACATTATFIGRPLRQARSGLPTYSQSKVPLRITEPGSPACLGGGGIAEPLRK